MVHGRAWSPRKCPQRTESTLVFLIQPQALAEHLAHSRASVNEGEENEKTPDPVIRCLTSFMVGATDVQQAATSFTLSCHPNSDPGV